MNLISEIIPYGKEVLSGLAFGFGTYILPIGISIWAGLRALRAEKVAEEANIFIETTREEIGSKVDAVIAFKVLINNINRLLVLPRRKIDENNIQEAKDRFEDFEKNERIDELLTDESGKTLYKEFKMNFEELCHHSAINKQTDEDLRKIRKKFADSAVEIFKFLKNNANPDEKIRLRKVLTDQNTTSIFSGKKRSQQLFY